MTQTVVEMATQYSEYDLENLYSEIGRRASVAAEDPKAAIVPPSEFSTEYKHLGFGDDIMELGKRIARRLLRELREVLCGSNADDAADRKKLQDAFGLGRDAIVAAVAAFLAGPLGVAAAIAAAVAAIFVGRVLEPTYKETCEFWEEKSDD